MLDRLDAAIEGLRDGFAAVAAALHDLAPRLAWTRTASYLDRPPDPTFLVGYAHATLLGPRDDADPAAPPARAALGLLLLGPGISYPPHHHPADEVYVPLSRARWLDASGDMTPREPGEVVHHEPWQPHAVRVDATDPPALFVYLWTGDVVTPSRWYRPGDRTAAGATVDR